MEYLRVRRSDSSHIASLLLMPLFFIHHFPLCNYVQEQMKSALFASNTPSRDDDVAKFCVAVHSVVWIVPHSVRMCVSDTWIFCLWMPRIFTCCFSRYYSKLQGLHSVVSSISSSNVLELTSQLFHSSSPVLFLIHRVFVQNF